MSDNNSLAAKIRELTSNQDTVGQLLSETERINSELSARGINLTDEQLIHEAIAVRIEREERTVLISEPDPEIASRLSARISAEKYRVVSCPTLQSLEALLNGRESDFHFTGIIYSLGSSDSDRLPAIPGLIGRTVTPCVRIRYDPTGQDIKYLNYSPRPVSAQHSALAKILNEVYFSSPSGTDDAALSGFVQAELLANDDVDAVYHRAERHRRERSFIRAIEDYTIVLGKNAFHTGAITGLASLLLRKNIRSSVLHNYFSDGLVGLVNFLREKKAHLTKEDIVSLLGEALVLLYEEKVSTGEAEEDCKGILSEAIELLEQYRSINEVNKNKPNVLAYLALANAFKNTPESRKEAYDLIDVVIRHSDIIGEGISDATTYERHIAKTLGWRDLELGGSRLMQLTGMNRVLGLNSDVIVKHFAMKDFEHARNEVHNITTLARHSNELTFSVNGREQRLVIPSRAHLLYREEDLQDPTASVYVVMPNLLGTGLASHFEDLDGVSRDLDDKEARTQAISAVKGIKIEHLEWLVDSCARLQVVGTRHLTLNDIRNKDYVVSVGTDEKKVGFYAKRVFDKLCNPKIAAGGYAHLAKKNKSKLLSALRPFDSFFKDCPEWLWMFYSDSNIRNYLIEYTGNSPSNRQDWVVNSRKMRVDFENGDLRLGMTDPISTIEHELSDTGESFKKVASLNDYLMNRWLARVMLSRLPEYWANTPPSDGAERAYQLTMFKQFSSKFHTIMDTKKNGERRKYLADLMDDMLPRLEPDFSLQEFKAYWHTESMLRHMTIVADKIKEIGLITQRLGDMKNKYPFLKQYVPLGTWTYEYKRLEQDRTDDENSGVNLLYCKLQMSKEHLDADRRHHLEYFFFRADELKQTALEGCAREVLEWE